MSDSNRDQNSCSVCGEKSTKICPCGAKYCSVECQKKDWPEHQKSHEHQKSQKPKPQLSSPIFFGGLYTDETISEMIIKNNWGNLGKKKFPDVRNVLERSDKPTYPGTKLVNANIGDSKNPLPHSEDLAIAYIIILTPNIHGGTNVFLPECGRFDTGNQASSVFYTKQSISTHTTIGVTGVNSSTEEKQRNESTIIILKIDEKFFVFFENLIVKSEDENKKEYFLCNSRIISCLNDRNIYIKCLD